MAFAGILRQSTAVDVLIGPFVDSTDGDAEETGLTIAQGDVRLSKNGQTAAQKSDNTTCAHDADGFYNCELDATDTNTVGQLTLYVHVAGALAVRHDFQVVEEAVYDNLFAASAPGPLAANSTGSGLSAIPWNAAWDAEVQSEAADALTAYDPPTNAEMEARTLAAASYATATALQTVDDEIATIDSNVDAILADTGTDGVIVATNNDKTGYAIGAGGISNTAFAANAVDAAALAADAGTEIAAAVLAAAESTPIEANVKEINDTALTGDGSNTPWGPA